MPTETLETWYGGIFEADRKAMMAKLAEDLRNASDLEKVWFVVEARAMFFGGFSRIPEEMKSALQTCIEKYIFGLPFTMEDVRPSTSDFGMALGMLRDGFIPIDKVRAEQLIEILNIGAK